jgi:hypothetical protein
MNFPWSIEYTKYIEKKIAEVEGALITARGRISLAAEALGVPRPTLQRWIKDFDLGARVLELRLAGGAGKVGRPRKPRSTK